MLSSAMPSPPLTSDPNFSKTDTRRPSSGSSKSGTLHLVKKFLTTTQDGSSRRSKHQQPYSDLTQEKLEVFNDTIAIADDINKKTSGYSPYYKGLTDSSLALNRQRTAGSPGRESHAPTVASSTSFSTSFIIRMQEMSSCFGSSRKKKKNGENEERDVKIYSGRAPPIVDEKPLRERASSPVTNRIVDLELEKDAYDNNIRASHSHNIERFTWANRYRPAALQHFICNRDKALELQATVRSGAKCSHFIFEGPSGVGKRTMILAFLREIFGPDRVQTKEELKEFDLKGEGIGPITIKVKISAQHIEVNLNEAKGYEKHVIVELIKETHNAISNTAVEDCNRDNCRAIVVYGADKLSTDALLYIRWLLERYRGCNKVFFCCFDISKLQPVKTLCTIVQLFQPSNKEIVDVLEFIAEKENILLPHELAEKFAEKSKRNLRQAIRSFEASWQANHSFKEHQLIMTGWEDDIANIARNIIDEQSPKQLYDIRGKLNILIEHDVPPDFIFKTLVGELKKHLGTHLHSKIDSLYAECNMDEERIRNSGKHSILAQSRSEEMSKRVNDPVKKNGCQFLRIEEFIAKFMSFYKNKGRASPITIHLC